MPSRGPALNYASMKTVATSAIASKATCGTPMIRPDAGIGKKNQIHFNVNRGDICISISLFFRAMEGHPSLLFAHKTDIRKISLDTHNDMVAIVNETRSSCAIDYNFRTGMIYWSDVMTQKIYK